MFLFKQANLKGQAKKIVSKGIKTALESSVVCKTEEEFRDLLVASLKNAKIDDVISQYKKISDRFLLAFYIAKELANQDEKAWAEKKVLQTKFEKPVSNDETNAMFKVTTETTTYGERSTITPWSPISFSKLSPMKRDDINEYVIKALRNKKLKKYQLLHIINRHELNKA